VSRFPPPDELCLDEAAVAGLVAEQFPDLAGLPVGRLGAGWDHLLFTAGGEWIFRFPRRAERVAWLEREATILAVAAETLPPRLIPRFELLGRPAPGCPFPFVGYRALPGAGADQSPVRDLPGLAGDVGRLLGRLHRADPARIPATPGGWEGASLASRQADLAAVADVAGRALAGAPLAEDLLTAARPYLAGRVAPPAAGQVTRFIHNDICPDHLLTDPATGRLTGLIDFTDAMAGDPVLDFVGLIGIGGYPFIRRVRAAYPLPAGPGFGARLRWLCRTLTLTWLAEAVQAAPADVPKHLTWVAHAFRD
jgi:aminoglycoside phosphotransferase (APT) family kinase protein